MKKRDIIPHKPLHPAGVKESPPMLIHDISHLCRAKMREVDSEMLQDSTRLIIINLSLKDGVTQLDLVKSTHLKPPTVSVTLKRLETTGYVRRETDKNDMRAIRVYLTEKGKELNRESFRQIKETDEILMRGINEEESLFLTKLLTKMLENMLQELDIKGED